MNIKVGAIVLSRFDSSRLPGKALRQVNNKALIEYVLEKAYKVKGLNGVCVATSSRNIDDPIAEFCKQNDVPVFRGSGDNVAERFLKCMEWNGWDAAVRINGDSPLHSSELLSKALDIYSPDHMDMVTNVFPRSYPIGMSVELVSQSALRRAFDKMVKASNFEHVTEYFYENAKDFNLGFLPKNNIDHSKISLAVDTQSNFERFKWLIDELGSEYLDANYQNIIDLYISYEKHKS
tara:strand:- start:765 stop:1469 length:705 start_codon:yes stop_codon:yes gene_type:complete